MVKVLAIGGSGGMGRDGKHSKASPKDGDEVVGTGSEKQELVKISEYEEFQ